MKIRISPEGKVDFEAPIQMTENQREKFVNFFEESFENVTVREGVSEETRPGLGGGERKEWTLDHYSLLLSSRDNEDIAKEMGRSEMSVSMKRGSFVPNFMAWAKEKGYAQTRDKSVIKEYLEERG